MRLECEKVYHPGESYYFIDLWTFFVYFFKGYKYYHALSEGVLRLQERGVFDKLHTKWWKAKRGGGACQVGFIYQTE